jgi:hypothetical protein
MMTISSEIFREQRRPRFGAANPERMYMVFWEWMILGGQDISVVRQDPKFSGFGPSHARDVFKASHSRENAPIWTFDRYGATRTGLADGRLICVGGEHEDFYDPDFWIYNDVVVVTASNQVEIYGYPAEIFPPTDFHTATLVGDRLFIIGSVGYKGARQPGETPVYVLNLSGYEVSAVRTSGEKPGWLHEHSAELNADGGITIRGGQVLYERDGRQALRRNFDDYVLNVASGVWRRATHHKWHQFRVRQEDGKLFILEQRPEHDAIVPEGSVLAKADGDPEFTRIKVEGVPVAFHVGVKVIEIVVEDDDSDTARRIAEQIRVKTEAAIHKPCILEAI